MTEILLENVNLQVIYPAILFFLASDQTATGRADCLGFELFAVLHVGFDIQSTLGISKSKGPSKTVRDIRTSTNQICRIEENTKQTTKFHK